VVTDVYGNAVANAPLVLTASAGTVSPSRVMSDAHGAALVRWTLGSKPGEQRLTGTVTGGPAKGFLVINAAVTTAAPKPTSSIAAPKPTSRRPAPR